MTPQESTLDSCGHDNFAYRHDPKSVPQDYQICRDCGAINASEAIEHLIQERERLARINELEQQHSWIIDFNDDVAFNLEKRIEELKAVKVKAVTK